MNTIDIKISLNPVDDGAELLTKKIIRKDEGALVIGTNGQSRIADCDETAEILDRLSGVSHGEFIGKSDFMAVFNADKIMEVGGGRYFIGSALILKQGNDGLTTLKECDFETAAAVFESRLGTLVCDGQGFSAYERY